MAHAFDKVLPPRSPKTLAVTTSASAATPLLMNGYVRFRADGGKIYVIFGDLNVAAPVIGTNAWPIADGETIQIYIDPADVTHIRGILSTGSATLLWAPS